MIERTYEIGIIKDGVYTCICSSSDYTGVVRSFNSVEKINTMCETVLLDVTDRDNCIKLK